MTMRLALMVERRDESALASVFDRALQLRACGGNIEHREMRDRNEASPGVAAEIRDPAIVGAAVGVTELRVFDLRFPQQPDSRVQNRFVDTVLVEQLETFLRVHRTERRRV